MRTLFKFFSLDELFLWPFWLLKTNPASSSAYDESLSWFRGLFQNGRRKMDFYRISSDDSPIIACNMALSRFLGSLNSNINILRQ